MKEPKLTLAEKIALAQARLKDLGIEPITTRQWKPAISHITQERKPTPEPAIVTRIRRKA